VILQKDFNLFDLINYVSFYELQCKKVNFNETTLAVASVHVVEASDGMDYEQLKIKSYKHWDLYLHENQCYLGRVFLLLKNDEGVEDFLAIEGEVRDEFFQIGAEVKMALKTLFQPDRINYIAQSNTSPKIHMHLVPRYKDSREFAGIVFKDIRWGSNYAPYDHSFVLEKSILFQIRDAVKKKLS
jgi:diadenosine tetraphosphate (Ap4A) HIT family hydrolase